MFREQWDGTEIGTAAAVFPRLKTLSLEICSCEGTNPELSLVYHMQSLKAEEILKKRNKKLHCFSGERNVEKKMFFSTQRSRIISDLIFKSIIDPHMLILGIKYIICFAGSKSLPLRG